MQEVLMHIAKEVPHLIQLKMGRTDQFRGAGEIVADGNCKDLNDHHHLDFFLSFFIFVYFFKLCYLVLIFISKLPPIRAELTDSRQLGLSKIFN